MKPDQRFCDYCGQELHGRADRKFCSEAHRKAFVRSNGDKADKIPQKGGQIKADKQIESIEKDGEVQNGFNADNLTKTDRTFYNRAMKDFGEPYYKFGEKEKHKEECLQCKKKFTTTLGLLRFCSYNHYHEAISGKI